MNGLIRALFFGNYFYGICAIALSIEASTQQNTGLNSEWYYLILFTGTILYYTYAYISESSSISSNKRAVWYADHHKKIILSQWLLTIIFLFAATLWIYRFRSDLLRLTLLEYLILLVFPIVGILYYGSGLPGISHNLRNNGWLKPFVIGFVWAGAVTIYPILFHSIESGGSYPSENANFLLFIKNFMFISVLAIMFDIKDYASDHNQRLKTFVVQIGLRKTIFFILLPLCMIGLGTFLVYAIGRHFPLMRILVNTIPFILLIIVAYSMHRRKSILYYLAIIDGLMLIKAFCGIIGMSFTN